jgi:hypothetical protein
MCWHATAAARQAISDMSGGLDEEATVAFIDQK